MAEKGADDWALEERPLADVVGLDAEAEWLLGSGTTGGEARKLFLSDTLTADYEFRTYPERESLPLEADRDKGGRPPFSLLISPEPGGKNGKDILRVLKCIAEPEAEYAKDDGSDDAPAERLIMSMAEQQVLKDDGIAGAICNLAFFEAAIASSEFRELSKVVRLSSALRERAVPTQDFLDFAPPDWLEPSLQEAWTASPKNGSEPVVVGVIDDSFAIGHPRFQFTDGRSRIFSYWDQEADVEPHDPTVLFGRELLSFNPKDLDDFSANWPNLPGLDCFLTTARNEKRPVAEFYSLPAPRLRPFYPPRPMDALRLASHGTHVLDLAAGAPSQPPADLKGLPKEQGADAAPALVLVKLPRASVQDTSGAHLEFYLLQGVRHIVSRARMINPDAKVVIVSSYGFYGGPHDGASQLERALDEIVSAAPRNVEIVLPSGNGRLVRSHTRRDFNDRDVQDVLWRLPPDDRTPTVMEIWSEPYPADAGAMMELSLKTPEGRDSAATGVVLKDDETSQQIVLVKQGQVVARAVCVHPSMHPRRRLFLVWIWQTATAGAGSGDVLAASGAWTVRLRALDPVKTRPASVWIRRDDSLVGFPSGGRQSGIERDDTRWKDDPNYDQETRELVGDDGTAQRSATISAIATGSWTVIAGGFDVDRAYSFPVPSSAGGPAADRVDLTQPERRGPDALAPSQIFSGIGIAAAGFFGGGEVRFRGTSVAAPLVASEIARAITENTFPGGRDFVQDRAASSEATLPARSEPSSDLGGQGRYITERMRDRGMRFENSS